MTNSIIDVTFKAHFSGVGAAIRPEQRDVIQSVLNGDNTLCLMPTGAGKSLCYWVAGKALAGMTIVIFPLTALMDEQALKLKQHGQRVVTLHSGINARQQYQSLLDMYNGDSPDFLFMSPERMATDGFLEHVLKYRREDIKLVVIDEIHCISQWGVDFRPFYKEIPPFLDAVFGNPDQHPTILGLTATLNQKDTAQICHDFHIAPNHVLRSQYLLRYGINLNVIKVNDEPEKEIMFWEKLAEHRHEKVLIYIDNRRSGDRSTEGLCQIAQTQGFSAAYFHGSMTSDAKAEVIQKFKEGEILTVFATSAFGMGIDIPDIRGVIHFRPPESVEQYYQQIGRVGRDGRSAWALLYYSDKNIDFRKRYFIDQSFPQESHIQEAFTTLTTGTGSIKTYNYFDEQDSQSAFHYLLRSDVVGVLCKGIQNIGVFEKSKNVVLPEFDSYQNATRKGILILAARETNTPVPQIVEDLYRWQAQQKIKAVRSPAKCLVIEQKADTLPEEKISEILADAAEKKTYRYELLDDLVELLEAFSDSLTLHQDIGRYLGIDIFQLGRILETVSGVMVRSKSEVIIANLLTTNHIPFHYERKLKAGGVTFSPDFTIEWQGKTYYWEHLGRLDLETYRQNWLIKKRWYNEHFPGQLLTTEESSLLSHDVEVLIKDHFLPDLLFSNEYIESEPTAVSTESFPEFEQEEQKAVIWTEGRTDWKHLKAAFTRLKASGRFPSLALKFIEEENDMGDNELLAMCRSYSRSQQLLPTFMIFDRDVSGTLNKIVENDKDYKNWGNGVYSVALPVPNFRQDTPEICIEFYYRDDEIKRLDENGRRLFISNEFSPRSGRHETEPLNCADQNKVSRFTIVDNKVFDDNEENMALSKNDFATNVLNNISNFDDFDFSAFEVLFKLIEKILSA